MSDETTQNTTIPLKFGGKELVEDIEKEVDQYDFYHNTNQVYINAVGLNSSGRSQIEINNPSTMVIKLGEAKLKTVTPDNVTTITNTPVYIKAYTSDTVSASGIKDIKAGKGINVDSSSSDVLTISIDQSVVALKGQTGSDSSSSSTSGNFNNLYYYQLQQLLNLMQIVYDEQQTNKFESMQYAQKNTNDYNCIGFTLKYKLDNTHRGINTLRIRTNSTTPNNVYCAIRKCKHIDQSGSGGYVPPIDFNEYLNQSQIISVSKSTDYIDNQHYVWHFAKNFDFVTDFANDDSVDTDKKYSIYLITFHNTKSELWDENSLHQISVKCNNESVAMSDLQYIWNQQFNATQTMPYAIFSRREPIGTIIKNIRYGS